MRKRKLAAALVLVLCVAAAAALCILAAQELTERQAGRDYYADLLAQVQGTPVATFALLPTDTPAPTAAPTASIPVTATAPEPTPAPTATPSPTKMPSRLNFAALQQAMPEIRGWITVPGTVIDYPIVQGTDNAFYLDHLPDGTPNRSGSIMLDASNAPDFSDTVSILHGHHMQSGEMFGDLELYGKAAYAAQHPEMLLCTPQGDYRVTVLAAATVDGSRLGLPTSFADEEAFEAFLRQIVQRSAWKPERQASREDRLLLLSTCDYDFANARFVVLGRLEPIQ